MSHSAVIGIPAITKHKQLEVEVVDSSGCSTTSTLQVATVGPTGTLEIIMISTSISTVWAEM